MKNIAIISATVLAFAISTQAQNRFDGTYSTANYKHPNKAATAAKLNLDKQTEQAYEASKGVVAFGNYKNTFAESEGTGGAMPILPVEIGTGIASSANYKLQNRAVQTAPATIEQPVQPVVFNLAQ